MNRENVMKEYDGKGSFNNDNEAEVSDIYRSHPPVTHRQQTDIKHCKPLYNEEAVQTANWLETTPPAPNVRLVIACAIVLLRY